MIVTRVAQYTMGGKLVDTFESVRDASRKTGIPRTSIQNYLQNTVNHAGGFVWIKAAEDEIVEMLPQEEYNEELLAAAIDDGYDKLGLAIAGQAIRDYKQALDQDDEEKIDELVDFIYSDYFRLLTDGLDPDVIIEQTIRIHKKFKQGE